MALFRPAWYSGLTIMLATLFPLTVCAQDASGTPIQLPVTLSLKKKVSAPIDPRKVFPEINYTVAADTPVRDATWIFSVEKGRAKGTLAQFVYPILALKEQVRISLPGKAGTLVGKDGGMQEFLSMWIDYSKIEGEGTVGLVLVDFKDWQEKEGQARRLSNVLEFPVKLVQ
jgi:hypothetical protein